MSKGYDMYVGVVLGLLADVCVIGHWHRSIVTKVIKTSVWLLFGYVPPA